MANGTWSINPTTGITRTGLTSSGDLEIVFDKRTTSAQDYIVQYKEGDYCGQIKVTQEGGSSPTPTESITFTLNVTNEYSSQVKFNGEMLFYMKRLEENDYDNTGKGANATPPGILLEGYTNGNNTITIEAGETKPFTITITKSMLYRNNKWLSYKTASQEILVSQGKDDPNVAFYSRGRWNSGASGPAHILGAYKVGWLDDTTNGVELINGSTHSVKILSSQPSIENGSIIITDT